MKFTHLVIHENGKELALNRQHAEILATQFMSTGKTLIVDLEGAYTAKEAVEKMDTLDISLEP